MPISAKASSDRPASPAVWNPSRSYVRAVIHNLVTEARVGLHPWEQHEARPNRLVINVELFARLQGRLLDETSASIMDYDHIRNALRAWPNRPHTKLLETLLDELVGLCFDNPRVEACRVSIMKTDIFNEAEGAGVEVFMLRSDHGAAGKREA